LELRSSDSIGSNRLEKNTAQWKLPIKAFSNPAVHNGISGNLLGLFNLEAKSHLAL
jgi:hypothetical protein